MRNHNEYSDRYMFNLIPFFVISIFIHVLLVGGSIAYASLNPGGNDFSITVFANPGGAGSSERRSGTPGEEDENTGKTRIKIYRVDYFNRLLLESLVKAPSPPVVKPKKPDKNIQPKEKIDEQPKVKPIEPTESIDNPVIDEPPGKIFLADELSKEGISLFFPPYQFTLIPYNESNWLLFHSNSCIGYFIVYFVVDISKKDGFEEYFEWAKFFDYLFSIEGVKSPPTPIGIAEMMEDPFFLTPELAADAMRRRLERTEYNQPVYKKFNFIDFDGQVTDALEITELPKPQIYFVDDKGAVRMKLEGRLRDIKIDQVSKALSVIKDMWGMTDIEAALAVAAILSYQQKLASENKSTPSP